MARAAQADMDKAAGEKYANEKRIDELKAKLVLEKENQKVLLEQTKTINKNDNYYNLVVERANMSTMALSSMSSEIDNLTNRNLVLENSMNKTANAIGRYNTSATAGGLNLEGQDLSKGQKKTKEGKTRVQLLEEEYKDEIQKSDIFSTQLSESENVAFLRRLQITQKYIDEKLSKLDNLNKEEEKQLLDFQSELYKVIKANLDKRNKAEADALKETLQDLKDEADKRKELAKEQQDLNKKTADLEKQDNKDSADRAEAAIRKIRDEVASIKEKEKALQNLKQVIADSSLSIIESVGG
jgi:DNA repair exonuclease SbcCD ATPase subunit